MSKSKKRSCCLPWFVYVLVGLITGFIAVGASSFYSSYNFQFVWPLNWSLNWPLIITEAAQPQTAEVTPQRIDLSGSFTDNSSTDSSSQVTPLENRLDHVHIGSKVLLLREVGGIRKKKWGVVIDYNEEPLNTFPYTVEFEDGEDYPYCVGEFIEVEQKDPFDVFYEETIKRRSNQ
jgi:hypothetical protein